MTDREASKLVFPELSYQLSGIFFEVHNALGRFCNEQQYADATERLLKRQGLSYIREFQLPKSFEGERAGRNKVDFLVEDKLVIELKAKRITGREDYYQLRRYLQAAGLKLGIIVNFRDKYIKPKRILDSQVK